MQFKELDARMRVFETAHDLHVLPDVWIVARLDGRNFTRLTRELQSFSAPFDERFRDLMLATTEHLFTCGCNVNYAWTASDEISLLFARNENSFGRKERKLISVLAGEASAVFSLALGAVASFDCRLSQLPNTSLVMDYFRWRMEDAHRNALNAHCYWLLRKQGLEAQAATVQIAKQSIAAKNELLFQHGINFNDLPAWQKRGIGIYWESYETHGVNPQTGAIVATTRRRLHRNLELPLKEAYDHFVLEHIS